MAKQHHPASSVASARTASTAAWGRLAHQFRQSLEEHLEQQDALLQSFFNDMERRQVGRVSYRQNELDDLVPSETDWPGSEEERADIIPNSEDNNVAEVTTLSATEEAPEPEALAITRLESKVLEGSASESSSVRPSHHFTAEEAKLRLRAREKMDSYLTPWAKRNARKRKQQRFLRATRQSSSPLLQYLGEGCLSRGCGQLVRTMSWLLSLEEPERTSQLARFLQDQVFVIIVVCVIVGNTIYTTWAANYEMETLGQHPPYHEAVEAAFLSVFVLELVLKLMVHRMYFFWNDDWSWNMFDFWICVISMCDVLGLALPVGGFSFARSLRILKVAKILRVIRMLRFLREVRIMLVCMMGSMISLFWAIVMLAFIMFLFALFFMQEMAPYLEATSPDDELWMRQRTYFQTIFTTMHVLGMATTGGKDWEEVWILISPVGWVAGSAFLFYLLFFMFAVMNIITGVFVEHASILSKPDDEEAMIDHMRQLGSDIEYLTAIMELIDKDGSGFISVREFLTAMQNERIEYSFRSIGVDMRMPERYFTTMAALSDQTEISIKDLVSKIVDMKGSASRADVELLSLETRILKRDMGKMFSGLKGMFRRMHTNAPSSPPSPSSPNRQ